jgi:hypothetical protein
LLIVFSASLGAALRDVGVDLTRRQRLQRVRGSAALLEDANEVSGLTAMEVDGGLATPPGARQLGEGGDRRG